MVPGFPRCGKSLRLVLAGTINAVGLRAKSDGTLTTIPVLVR